MHKTIHQDWPRGGEIKAVYVTKAFQPGRGHVIKTTAAGVEELECLAFIVFVADRRQLVVDSVHVILNVIVADVEAVRPPVRVEHSEIAIEGAVLLQHENHVIYRSDPAGGSRGGSGRCGWCRRGSRSRGWCWRWSRRRGNRDAL